MTDAALSNDDELDGIKSLDEQIDDLHNQLKDLMIAQGNEKSVIRKKANDRLIETLERNINTLNSKRQFLLKRYHESKIIF